MDLIKLDVTNLYEEGMHKMGAENIRAPKTSDVGKLSHEIRSAWQKLQDEFSSSRVGFFDLPHQTDKIVPVEKLAKHFMEKDIEHFVLIGMGGSSLGAKCLIRALQRKPSALQFHYMDNSDPETYSDLFNTIEVGKTLFFVVTKSGTTVETIAGLLATIDHLESHGVSETQLKDHIVIATDPMNGDLRKLASRMGWPTLDVPSNVGGRFSVLTPVGLFPALFAGIEIRSVLRGAHQIRTAISQPQWESNPVLQLGATLVLHSRECQRDQTALMPYSSYLKELAEWFVQLWGESLGKENSGLTPLAAVGATDQHSQLQLFSEGADNRVIGFVKLERFHTNMDLPLRYDDLPSFKRLGKKSLSALIHAQLEGTRDSLAKHGRPNFTLHLPDRSASSMGQTLFFLETLTAFTGFLFGINPFDQPGVEESKKIAMEKFRHS